MKCRIRLGDLIENPLVRRVEYCLLEREEEEQKVER